MAFENKKINALTIKYGIRATQISTWKKWGLLAIMDTFSTKKAKNQQDQQGLAERNWLKKILTSLLQVKENLVDLEYEYLSIRKQCSSLGLNRISF